MKYVDIKVLFFTEEQEKLPPELKDNVPFAEMQTRIVRIYSMPLAVTVSMEGDKVRGSVIYLNGNDRMFSPTLPNEIHEAIEKAWG